MGHTGHTNSGLKVKLAEQERDRRKRNMILFLVSAVIFLAGLALVMLSTPA